MTNLVLLLHPSQRWLENNSEEEAAAAKVVVLVVVEYSECGEEKLPADSRNNVLFID